MNPVNVAAREYRRLHHAQIRETEKASKKKRLPQDVDYNRRRRHANPEKWRQYAVEYRRKNLAQARARDKAYHSANKEKRKQQQQASNLRHPDRIPAYNRKYRQAHKAELDAKNKEWQLQNRSHVLEYREKYGPRRRELRKLRWASDPLYRLREGTRRTIGDELRLAGVPKTQRSFSVLGCTVEFFKAYLEQRFEAGMSWDNWGQAWEIDHRIPISSFDLSDHAQLKNAFHYSNCRPLPKIENRTKHAKLPEPHQGELL